MKYVLLALLSVLASCSKEVEETPVAPTPQPWFEDAAKEWGVDFTYQNGAKGNFHIKEVTGGGAALFDYDNDSDLDLYVVQGSAVEGNALFENVGGIFVNRSQSSGADDNGYGIGVATGDYDNDGDVDLYVTNIGVNALLRNDGNGKFTDVTTFSGTEDEGFSACSAFGDLDGDGDLDLVVTKYLDSALITDRECLDAHSQRTYCNPTIYDAPMPDTLFINNGDGTFTDATESSGLASVKGTGLGVFISDLTGDALPDIFIANDAMPDRLWVNQGDGTFIDEAMHRNIATDDSGMAKAGMGATPVDFDQDGDFDVFVTNIYGESDSFYKNEGDFFQDITRRTGLSAETRAYTRWGIAFVDFNNDGLLDLYETTGGVVSGPNSYSDDDPLAEPNLLFVQGEKGRFSKVIPQGGTRELLIGSSHGVASGDIDGDGGIDLVVVNSNKPVNILKNVLTDRGNWIAYTLLNKHGAPAIGATMEVVLNNGRSLFSQVQTSLGYASVHSPTLHFGIGKHAIEKVVITWKGGSQQVFENPDLNRMYTLKNAE
jgi:enediyne biosynthesis protein E4